MDTRHIQPKTVVVVRRKWHSPEIHAFIDKEEVGAKMDVQDFVKALVTEMYTGKNRFIMLSKDAASGMALSAADSILNEMKSTTGNVV
jgi:hypothetical protein